MKAAVILKKDKSPKYVEGYTEPTVQSSNELLISIKASAISNLDKMKASGQHYSTQNNGEVAKVVGTDGVGILEEGTRVYGIGINGTMAERALIDKNRIVKLPEGIDNALAAALPNPVMGSAMALRFRAKLQKGETVLINGATGVTGRVAVQIAKHYGARKVIATSINEDSLKEISTLGADETILLKQSDKQVKAELQKLHRENPIDVVIDYLWGSSAELILNALKGNGNFSHHTRFISVGAIISDTITLSSSILRSTAIQLSGSGIGSWTRNEVQILTSEILPEMFQLAKDGKLKLDTVNVPLKEIEQSWNKKVEEGKRMVVLI